MTPDDRMLRLELLRIAVGTMSGTRHDTAELIDRCEAFLAFVLYVPDESEAAAVAVGFNSQKPTADVEAAVHREKMIEFMSRPFPRHIPE